MSNGSVSASFTNAMPSPMRKSSRGSSQAVPMVGRCALHASTTRASISTITHVSTSGCFRTSRAVPPSPPPMTSARRMRGALVIAGCTSISW